MRIITRNDYKEIITKSGFTIDIIEYDEPIDVYHVDEWDRTVKNWENENRKDSPIDFFCAAKDMKDFFEEFINKLPDEVCYFAAFYQEKYKMRYPYNEVTKILHDELKMFLNSIGLRKNTSKSIEFKTNELIQYIGLWSFAGFGNVSEFSLFFPKSKFLVEPYHHMNYLIYSENKNHFIEVLKQIETKKIKVFK